MERLLHIATLLLACLALASPSQAADSQPDLGGGTPQFQCDVNTNVCTCEGSKHGSDCLAMRENCWDSSKRARVVCKNPATRDGGCACCLRGAECNLPYAGGSLAGPSVRTPSRATDASDRIIEGPADGILERPGSSILERPTRPAPSAGATPPTRATRGGPTTGGADMSATPGATPPASCMDDCMAACTRSSPRSACQPRCSGMCSGR